MLDSPYTESLLVTANYSTPENEGSQRNVSRECRHVAIIAQRPHARAAAECATQVYTGLAVLKLVLWLCSSFSPLCCNTQPLLRCSGCSGPFLGLQRTL